MKGGLATANPVRDGGGGVGGGEGPKQKLLQIESPIIKLITKCLRLM
jgi:hypothetical protein